MRKVPSPKKPPPVRSEGIEMTNKTTDHRDDLSVLRDRLEGLEIVLSQKEGSVIVASYSEPLFCFERPDLLSANLAVTETLRSYISTFYKVRDVKISTKELPLAKPKIPVSRIEPTGWLTPTFEGAFTRVSEAAIS